MRDSTADLVAAIISGGAGLAGAAMQGKANSNAQQVDRQALLSQLLANVARDEQEDARQGQRDYMDTFSMNPLAQQQKMFATNALRDYAMRGPSRVGAGDGALGSQNPFSVSDDTMAFLDQGALADNAGRFFGAAGSLNPLAPHAQLGEMGFGEAGRMKQHLVDNPINAAASRYDALGQERRNALIKGLMQTQAQGQQRQGTSKKRKLLGILGAIGGGIAAPFTGGLSLGAIGPSLNYGYGAGSKTGTIGGLAAGIGGATFGGWGSRIPWGGGAGGGGPMSQIGLPGSGAPIPGTRYTDYFNRPNPLGG